MYIQKVIMYKDYRVSLSLQLQKSFSKVLLVCFGYIVTTAVYTEFAEGLHRLDFKKTLTLKSNKSIDELKELLLYVADDYQVNGYDALQLKQSLIDLEQYVQNLIDSNIFLTK